MNARSVSPQLCLDGTEAWFAPAPWQPRPALLAKVKAYFEGYARTQRPIFGRRAYVAGQLKISVRTLARYMKYLRESGWLATIQRKARYCIRRVLAAVPSRVLSLASGPFSDVTSRGKAGFTPRKRPEKQRAPITDWYEFARLSKLGLSDEEALRKSTYGPDGELPA